MKLKIERNFKDKYTGKKYKAGDEVEFKDDRAKELLSDPRGLTSKVKEEPKEEPKEELKEELEKPAKKSKK